MSARSASRSWSTPADVVASLRRRWDSGSLLARYASGDGWEPIGMPLRAPTARASRPDGTSDVGAMSVYAAIDEVAVSDANAPVAPASEPTMPRTREAEAIRRNAMTEG